MQSSFNLTDPILIWYDTFTINRRVFVLNEMTYEKLRGKMMFEKQSIKIMVTVLTLAVIVGSCFASNRIDLVDQGVVSLEQQHSKKVRIAWGNVKQDGEDIIVSGALMRRAITSYPIWRHVKITVLAPDGTVLQEARTSNIKVPRRVPGRGFNTKRFEVRLAGIPPRGSLVRISLCDKDSCSKEAK